MSEVLERAAAIVGASHVLTTPDAMAPHLREWRDLFHGRARAVLKPGSTAEVAAIMQLAAASGQPIVPQGGNTGLVGGQIPMGDGGEIVVSLARLNRIRATDADNNTMIVEAGVTLQQAQEAAAGVDRLFPLSLASQGSCTIGGNLSTNAGGTAVLAYGSMRDLCLGLEVVLADGRIWNGLSTLRKDNTGLDLKSLFIGAEGTLGLITAAALKLFPRPRARTTAFVAVAGPTAALTLFNTLRSDGDGVLTTFEILPRFGLEVVLRHVEDVREPLAEPAPWYVLAETSGHDEQDGREAMEAVLADAFERGLVLDASIATSGQQAAAFWRIRELISEVQGREGGSIKHDVSVPVSCVPAFLERAMAAAAALIPGCRPLPFGHLGDGNIHFNVSQPVDMDKAAFLARWGEMNAVIHGVVREFGGSISAEHGIGRLKRDLLPGVKDPVALDLMRRIKNALDPQGIMNPGALL